MKNKEELEQYDLHLFPTYNRFPIVLDHGSGATLYDNDGNEYVDFMAGIAVNSLGYGDKGLIETIVNQIGKLQHVSNLYYTEPVVEGAQVLADATGFDKVFFTNSGAEANECALKLARKHQVLNKNPEATKIISMNGSFHGRTYATLTATGQPEYHKDFGPMLPDIEYAEFNDLNSLEETLGDGQDIAAVILEPIRGEGGIIEADPKYLQGVRDLCNNTNTLLIFDEVQCGASRTGEFLACENYGIKPDIVTMAKGIGSGFPVGACLANSEIADTLSAGTHGTTYGGNALATGVVNYVVTRLNNQEFKNSIKSKGELLKNGLIKLQEKYPDLIKEVRGTGLMQGIELTIPVLEVINKCLEKGLLVISAAGNVIRIVPPLVISEEEIGKGLNILDQVLTNINNN